MPPPSPFAREGGPVKDERDRLDPDPPPAFRRTLDAIRHLERAVVGAEGLDGIVLLTEIRGASNAKAKRGARLAASLRELA